LETLEGEVFTSERVPVDAPPQASTLVCKLDFSDQITQENRYKLVFVAELWHGDRFITRQTAYFVPIKHLTLSDPGIIAKLHNKDGELIVELVSHSLAVLVEVSLTGADVVFSDNYFNLPAGREVTLTCSLPPGWTFEQARKSLVVCSVYDSYAHGDDDK
jgi:beta-mannosidase